MFTRIGMAALALAPLTATAKAPVTTTKLLGNWPLSNGSIGAVLVRKAPLQDRYRVTVPNWNKPGTAWLRFSFGKNQPNFDLKAPLLRAKGGEFATFRLPHNFVAVNRGSEQPTLQLGFSGGVWMTIAHAD